MSRYIATRHTGAHSIVNEAEEILRQALADRGPRLPQPFQTPPIICH